MLESNHGKSYFILASVKLVKSLIPKALADSATEDFKLFANVEVSPISLNKESQISCKILYSSASIFLSPSKAFIK